MPPNPPGKESGKIPCLVIIYHDFPIIKACLDFLAKNRDQLDIFVIENRSEHTETLIKPYALELLRSHAIQKYFLFAENISMNAFEVVLQSGEIDLKQSEYVMVTDGDLTVEQPDWIEEQRRILQAHPDVFACGLTLDMRNLPVKAFPEAVHWVDKGTEQSDCFLASTGLWLLLMRAEGFRKFIDFHRQHDYPRFSDTLLRKYCKRTLGQKWVRTKVAEAYHLTWDRYANLNDPYTRMKTTVGLRKLFQHHRYCSFEVHTPTGVARHFPVLKYLKGARRSLTAAVLGKMKAAAQ